MIPHTLTFKTYTLYYKIFVKDIEVEDNKFVCYGLKKLFYIIKIVFMKTIFFERIMETNLNSKNYFELVCYKLKE